MNEYIHTCTCEGETYTWHWHTQPGCLDKPSQPTGPWREREMFLSSPSRPGSGRLRHIAGKAPTAKFPAYRWCQSWDKRQDCIRFFFFLALSLSRGRVIFHERICQSQGFVDRVAQWKYGIQSILAGHLSLWLTWPCLFSTRVIRESE